MVKSNHSNDQTMIIDQQHPKNSTERIECPADALKSWRFSEEMGHHLLQLMCDLFQLDSYVALNDFNSVEINAELASQGDSVENRNW